VDPSITFGAAKALLVAFAWVAVTTLPFIGIITRYGFRQQIRDDGPASHGLKEGTPSAGGVLMVSGICLAVVVGGGVTLATLALCGLVAGCGFVGSLDDYRKALFKRSLGLRAREKMVILLILAVVFSWIAIYHLGLGKGLELPWAGPLTLSPAVALALSIISVVFFTNAVNLTDGLDGLAAGSSAIVATALTIMLLTRGSRPEAVFCAGLAGACLGFLLFNAHPAAIFMGDTGALALGGGLAGVAILAGQQFLLWVVGMVFVVEALSVIAQVTSFKLTGRRILRMSPLHHHFELAGMGETQVVRGFWLASVVFSLLGVTLLERF